MITSLRLLILCFNCAVSLVICTNAFSEIIDRVQMVSKLPQRGMPTDMISFNNKAYFLYNSQSLDDRGLWVSDGTEKGTKIIKNIQTPSGVLSRWPSWRFVSQKMVYVYWRTPADSNRPIILNGNFYFIDGGRQLWKSNGTAEGTLTLMPGLYDEVFSATVLNSHLYLLDSNSLWRTDGTPIGTKKIASTGGFNLITYKSRLFFDGYDSTHGRELWISDGTSAGTKLFADIKKSYTYYFCGSPENWCKYWGSFPGNFAVYNNELYFSADDGVHGGELWKTDGTHAGTILLADIDPAIRDRRDDMSKSSFTNPMVIGKHLIFKGSDGVHGPELWRTDGTKNGTTLLKDLEPGPDGSGALDYFTGGMNNEIYFTASTGLWKTDGTHEGTKLLKSGLKNFSPGSTSLAILHDRLYFRASRQDIYAYNQELWVTDGSSKGTYQVLDLLPGKIENGNFRSSSPGIFVRVGDVILFRAKYSPSWEWPNHEYGLYKLERGLVTTTPFLELILGQQKTE